MTVQGLIDLLKKVDNKDLQVMIWDYKNDNHIKIASVTLFDTDNPLDSDNILGINFNSKYI